MLIKTNISILPISINWSVQKRKMAPESSTYFEDDLYFKRYGHMRYHMRCHLLHVLNCMHIMSRCLTANQSGNNCLVSFN